MAITNYSRTVVHIETKPPISLDHLINSVEANEIYLDKFQLMGIVKYPFGF